MTILGRLQLIWEVFKNKQTPWVVRIFLLLGFGYVLLPVDFIPDNLIPFGWMDDIALAIVLVGAAFKFTPEELLASIINRIRSGKNE